MIIEKSFYGNTAPGALFLLMHDALVAPGEEERSVDQTLIIAVTRSQFIVGIKPFSD